MNLFNFSTSFPRCVCVLSSFSLPGVLASEFQLLAPCSDAFSSHHRRSLEQKKAAIDAL